MAGGCHDDVIACHIAVGQRLAIDFRIRNHAGDIICRVRAASGCNPCEIVLEILNRARDKLEHLLRRHIFHSRAGQIGILPAEHLLGQHQHSRLILFGDTEDLHDDVERHGRSHSLYKVDFLASFDHRINALVRQPSNLAFNLLQIARHEPVLGELAIFWMDWRIEDHKAIDQHVRACGFLGKSSGLARCKHHRLGIVEEGFVVLRNPHHIIIARDQPERFEHVIFGDDFCDRRLFAQPVKSVEQRVPIGIAFRRDHFARCIFGQDSGLARHIYAPSAFAAYSSRNSRL